MNCKKTGCMYFDKTMTDHCARFEPPRVEGCTFRLGLREQNEQLRTDVESLRDEMKAIALALGRSKTDGESDCDWHDLAGDVKSLRTVVDKIACVASGEDQVADDDTEGMIWIRRFIAESV